MNKDQRFALGFVLIISIGSFISGALFTVSHMNNTAIEKGYKMHHPQTGKIVWTEDHMLEPAPRQD